MDLFRLRGTDFSQSEDYEKTKWDPGRKIIRSLSVFAAYRGPRGGHLRGEIVLKGDFHNTILCARSLGPEIFGEDISWINDKKDAGAHRLYTTAGDYTASLIQRRDV